MMTRCADAGVKGRIQNASVSFSTKNFVLLHWTHFFYYLVHPKSSWQRHAWMSWGNLALCSGETLWKVFWETLCEKFSGTNFEGKPHQAPFLPPLPTFRVKESLSFVRTGVHFAGPLYEKMVDGTTRKVWIYLFTCFLTYAVHLDLIADLSTPTLHGAPSNCFLCQLLKFENAVPREPFSDND